MNFHHLHTQYLYQSTNLPLWKPSTIAICASPAETPQCCRAKNMKKSVLASTETVVELFRIVQYVLYLALGTGTPVRQHHNRSLAEHVRRRTAFRADARATTKRRRGIRGSAVHDRQSGLGAGAAGRAGSSRSRPNRYQRGMGEILTNLPAYTTYRTSMTKSCS